ncbi:MAG: hypothetical protein ABJL54_09755 [Halioglobus sp.]
MLSLRELLSPRVRLLEQERRIRHLEQDLQQLQAQNASMREGMRRCVTCEYRLEFKDRHNAAPIEIATDN